MARNISRLSQLYLPKDGSCSIFAPLNKSPQLTMSSAFRRVGSKTSTAKTSTSLLGARGVKPWTGGIHLTSVGLNDLDAILGGGQPLGTCILLQEDRWTRDLALSLVKYWCAEVRQPETRIQKRRTNSRRSSSQIQN